jgi:hypothetical protein
LNVQLVGANPSAPAVGLDARPGTSNYFLGNDAGRWFTDVASYGQVQYHDVYAGIDVAYSGTGQGQLEYTFVVHPGANPRAIELRMQGADSLGLDGQGDLVQHTAAGDVVQQAPVLFQQSGSVRQSVSGRFVLLNNGHVGFQVGAYDATQTLYVDPTVTFSTYFGGSGTDQGNAIATDSLGNVYVTGQTTSTDFPVLGAYQSHLNGSMDAFVAKFDASENLVYSTYLGGIHNDTLEAGQGIAVDGAGNVVVAGATTSPDFPTTRYAYQQTSAGGTEAFVTALNATGNGLLWSTYYGGTGDDRALAVAINGGNLTGGNFNSFHQSRPRTVRTASTTAITPLASVWITGWTTSTDLPRANALQTAPGGGQDAFVAALDVGGGTLNYGSYLGGAGTDAGNGLAVGSDGTVYVTGFTASSNFPTTTPLQSSLAGAQNAFVTALDVNGSAYVYSTYLGGNSTDAGNGIAVDTFGDVYLTGSTSSYNFPTTAGAFPGRPRQAPP